MTTRLKVHTQRVAIAETIYAKIAAAGITTNANAKPILFTQIVNTMQLNQGTLG